MDLVQHVMAPDDVHLFWDTLLQGSESIDDMMWSNRGFWFQWIYIN